MVIGDVLPVPGAYLCVSVDLEQELDVFRGEMRTEVTGASLIATLEEGFSPKT